MPRSADLWPRIKAGVVSIIQGDSTIGGLAGGVQSHLLADMSNAAFPLVIVSYDGLQERFIGGDTETVLVEYPVLVRIHDNEDATKRHEKGDTYQTWRKALTDLFWQRGRSGGDAMLPDCPEVYKVTINPKPAIDPRAGWYPTMVSAVVVLCEAAESRH